MSVQSSVNLTNLVPGARAAGADSSNPRAANLSEENQLFSGVLDYALDSESSTNTATAANIEEANVGFVGPHLPDNSAAGFQTEANVSELEGNLLPILSGEAGGFNSLRQGFSLSSGVTINTNLESLTSTNTVLEQLRGLLTSANPVADSEGLRELRSRIVSLLDTHLGQQAANNRVNAEQAIANPVLSDTSQNSLRQELSATLNNIRSVLGEYLDRADLSRTEGTRRLDLQELSPNLFDSLQRRSLNIENLLSSLTASNSQSTAQNSVNQTINPILTQITSLITSSGAVTQPLINPVVDSVSLQPSNPAQTQVAAPLGSPQFSDELGQKIRWLVGQNFNAAQIRLNPAELGPVDVRVNVSGDQVSVAFNSQFGVVRDAIESALPKLRELLENQGLNLANADISNGENTAQQSDRDNLANTASSTNETIVDNSSQLLSGNQEEILIDATSSNLVDHFV